MSSLKPVCVSCCRFFRPEKIGFRFTEGMPNGRWPGPGSTPPGREQAAYWKPYKLWVGDLWRCQGCGAEIVVGVGNGPVAEHYQDGLFAETRRQGFNQLQVNDC